MNDSKRDGTGLATSLGWFSIALGTAELIAPRFINKLIGANDTTKARTVLRMFGVREILAGALILAGPRRPLPLWNRVFGDAIDLTAMALAARDPEASKLRMIASMASVAGVTAVDVIAGVRASKRKSASRAPVISAITVMRSPMEVYAAWREYERFPHFMHWVESVRELGNGLTEWTAKVPIAGSVTWTAITTEDVPGKRIAWQTLDDAKVPSRGKVTFTPTLNGIGTEIQVEMQYDVPLSRLLGEFFAKIATKEQVNADLKRFKQVVETGEVVRSDASIHAGPHPARPSQKGLSL